MPLLDGNNLPDQWNRYERWVNGNCRSIPQKKRKQSLILWNINASTFFHFKRIPRQRRLINLFFQRQPLTSMSNKMSVIELNWIQTCGWYGIRLDAGIELVHLDGPSFTANQHQLNCLKRLWLSTSKSSILSSLKSTKLQLVPSRISSNLRDFTWNPISLSRKSLQYKEMQKKYRCWTLCLKSFRFGEAKCWKQFVSRRQTLVPQRHHELMMCSGFVCTVHATHSCRKIEGSACDT